MVVFLPVAVKMGCHVKDPSIFGGTQGTVMELAAEGSFVVRGGQGSDARVVCLAQEQEGRR